LEEIVARHRGKVTPWIVFYKPSSTGDDWDQTDLWRTASAIPGAHVLRDVDGGEVERFHATTSGHTLLYDDKGDLMFSGGITFARGHSGDNLGQSSIESCLEGSPPESRVTPVFGCPVASHEQPAD
jgi:glyoxylase-like metal-dependent hydrolase (beta-lactamase superfamily II)